MDLDATESLLASAAKFAAGNTLGLTKEEVFAAIQRQAEQEARAAARSGQNVSLESLIQQKAAQLGTVPDLVTNYSEVPTSPGIKGMPADQENLRPDERGYLDATARAKLAEEEFKRDAAREDRRFTYETMRKLRGETPRQITPVSLTKDDYQEDREFGSGRGEYVRRMSGSEQRAERDAMRALSKELRRREDERMSNPEVEAANIFRAQAEARRQLRENMVAPEVATYRPNDVSNYVDAAVVEGQYVDPRTGAPVTTYEPVTTAIAGANTPDSAQSLNAPQAQSAVDYASKLVNGGMGFSRQQGMQNVDIGAEMAGLDDAVAKLGQSANYNNLAQVGAIRSLDALQKATDAIVAATGSEPMFAVDVETGKKREQPTPVGQRGAPEALFKLGLTGAQQERLLIALTQLSNAGQTTPYSVGMAADTPRLFRREDGKLTTAPSRMVPDVVSLDRPERDGLSSGSAKSPNRKILEAEVPLRRDTSIPGLVQTDQGKKFAIDASRVTEGMGADPQLASMAASPFIGLEAGYERPIVDEQGNQKTNRDGSPRVRRVREVSRFNMRDAGLEEAGARREANFMLRDVFNRPQDQKGTPARRLSNITDAIAGKIGRTPNITEVLDVMKQKAAKEGVRGLPTVKAERARRAAEKEYGRQQRFEDEQMARLLRGPLRPGMG